MTMELRRLHADEVAAAAELHRRAGALIPGYDPAAQPEREMQALYARTLVRGEVWGAWEEARLVGCLALEPGWIEHLYVEPKRHGHGIGRALIALAQAAQDDLQLLTYAANARARQVYERAGSVAEAFGIDESAPGRPANVRYRRRRP